MHQILSVAEEFVIAGRRHQLGLGVLVLAEDESLAFLVDVETVLDNRRQFDLETIVIDGLALCDVDLKG